LLVERKVRNVRNSICDWPFQAWIFFLFAMAAFWGNAAFVSQDNLPGNLVANSSFETGNSASLQGWIADSTWTKFARDVPRHGGQWSIKLEAAWAPQEGFAEAYLTGESGRSIYRLTAWMKTLHQWNGTISLGIKRSGQTIVRKSIGGQNPQWTMVTLSDTLALSRADTLVVRLSAGMTQVRRGEVLFDLVKLERIPANTIR
jgi:hypothetical protein